MLPVSPVDPTAPALIKRSQTPPPGKENAQRLNRDHNTLATPEPAIAELPRNRQSYVLGDHYERMAFSSLAIDAMALRVNPLELFLSRIFVTGIPSAVLAKAQ